MYPARAAARAWRGPLESAVEDVLSSPEVGRVLDSALAGPLPEEFARSLARHNVIERVTRELAEAGELERLIDRALTARSRPSSSTGSSQARPSAPSSSGACPVRSCTRRSRPSPPGWPAGRGQVRSGRHGSTCGSPARHRRSSRVSRVAGLLSSSTRSQSPSSRSFSAGRSAWWRRSPEAYGPTRWRAAPGAGGAIVAARLLHALLEHRGPDARHAAGGRPRTRSGLGRPSHGRPRVRSYGRACTRDHPVLPRLRPGSVRFPAACAAGLSREHGRPLRRRGGKAYYEVCSASASACACSSYSRPSRMNRRYRTSDSAIHVWTSRSSRARSSGSTRKAATTKSSSSSFRWGHARRVGSAGPRARRRTRPARRRGRRHRNPTRRHGVSFATAASGSPGSPGSIAVGESGDVRRLAACWCLHSPTEVLRGKRHYPGGTVRGSRGRVEESGSLELRLRESSARRRALRSDGDGRRRVRLRAGQDGRPRRPRRARRRSRRCRDHRRGRSRGGADRPDGRPRREHRHPRRRRAVVAESTAREPRGHAPARRGAARRHQLSRRLAQLRRSRRRRPGRMGGGDRCGVADPRVPARAPEGSAAWAVLSLALATVAFGWLPLLLTAARLPVVSAVGQCAGACPANPLLLIDSAGAAAGVRRRGIGAAGARGCRSARVHGAPLHAGEPPPPSHARVSLRRDDPPSIAFAATAVLAGVAGATSGTGAGGVCRGPYHRAARVHRSSFLRARIYRGGAWLHEHAARRRAVPRRRRASRAERARRSARAACLLATRAREVRRPPWQADRIRPVRRGGLLVVAAARRGADSRHRPRQRPRRGHRAARGGRGRDDSRAREPPPAPRSRRHGAALTPRRSAS